MKTFFFKYFLFVSIVIVIWSWNNGTVNAYTDVPSSHWAFKAIEWVTNTQLMLGPEQGKLGIFDPGGLVNRAQLAIIMERFYVLIKNDMANKDEVAKLKNEVTALKAEVEALKTNLNISKGFSIEDAIVDSNMSLNEALEGLDPNAPQEVIQNQSLVDVYYYSFDNKIHKGQILVDKRLVSDIKQIFDLVFTEKFPIESVIPVTRFEWSDEASMLANNSSSFNYRYIAGTTTLSMHAQGWAVDLNPQMNPFIKGFNGEIVQPEGATYDPAQAGVFISDSSIVKKFKELGWEWGGDWTTNTQGVPVKDYQHFEKTP